MRARVKRYNKEACIKHGKRLLKTFPKRNKSIAAFRKARWQNLAESIGMPVEETKVFKRRYGEQKDSAKYRGIEFLLTFKEWARLWIDSGRWYERGCKKGKYVMAKIGDAGPYSVDNVEIILYEENLAAQVKNINKTEDYRARMSAIMKVVRRNAK